jgi:hypothetical protein
MYSAGDGNGTPPQKKTVPAGEIIYLSGQGTMSAPPNKTFAGWKVAGGGEQLYVAGSSFKINEDTIFVAQWMLSGGTTYTVTFARGEATAGTAPENRTVATGDTTTLPNQGQMIAPAGKTFAGWRTGNGTIYAVGEIVTITADTVFTARWVYTPADTYTVTFIAGNGTGTVPGMTVYAGIPFALPAPDGMTAPTGSTFVGWKLEGGSGAPQAPGTSVTITVNTTYTAQWTTAYTVAFALGGATGTAPGTQIVAAGNPITLPGQGQMIAPTGKTFDGWKNSNGTPYAAGANVTINAHTTFTAQWKTATTYTVAFNRGEGTGTAPATRTVAVGGTITLPGQGQMIAPTGKTFDGWKTGSNATHAAGASVTINADTEFTAQWKTVSSGGGKLVQFMSGKASEAFGIKEPMSVDEFLAVVYFTWDDVVTVGAELYINNRKVASGSETIRPTDTVRIMAPEGFGEYTADEVIADITWDEFTTLAAFRLAGGKLYVNGKEVFSGSATVKITDDVYLDWPGEDDNLVEYFNGKLSDMDIHVAISANDLIMYGTGGEYDFAKFRLADGKLFVNSAEVTSGTRMIQPDDTVRVLAPAGFPVQANRLRFSFRGAAQRAAVQRLRKPWGYSRER